MQTVLNRKSMAPHSPGYSIALDVIRFLILAVILALFSLTTLKLR